MSAQLSVRWPYVARQCVRIGAHAVVAVAALLVLGFTAHVAWWALNYGWGLWPA